MKKEMQGLYTYSPRLQTPPPPPPLWPKLACMHGPIMLCASHNLYLNKKKNSQEKLKYEILHSRIIIQENLLRKQNLELNQESQRKRIPS
jgi:hypothetical protein